MTFWCQYKKREVINTHYEILMNNSYWTNTWYNFLKLLNIEIKVISCDKCCNIPDIIPCDVFTLLHKTVLCTSLLQRRERWKPNSTLILISLFLSTCYIIFLIRVEKSQILMKKDISFCFDRVRPFEYLTLKLHLFFHCENL